MPEVDIVFEEIVEDDPIPGMHCMNALVHDAFKFDEVEDES
jgi:hypothetical protein